MLNLIYVSLSADIHLHNTNEISKLHSYQNKSINSECARFNIPYPCKVYGISFVVRADSIGSEFKLRLFGNEGGATVPYYENDIIEPVTYKIKKKGLDTFSIDLAEELIIYGNQFFVLLQYSDTTIRLISDNIEKIPSCISEKGEMFYNQLMKLDSKWFLGKYGYAVTVRVEYIVPQNIIFKDVTSELGIDDSLYFNKSISLFDINRDSLIDILVDGRIYLNNDNFHFNEVTRDYKLSGRPKANFFIDINRDGLRDIVFLGMINDSNSIGLTNAKVFINQGENIFSEQSVQIDGLKNPQSFSIADLNNDEYQDIVVIQAKDSANDKMIFILLNDKENHFINIADKLFIADNSYDIATCSLIDYNNDNQFDISLVSESGEMILLENKSNLIFENVSSKKFRFEDSKDEYIYQYGTAISWIDINNDGMLDIADPNGIIFSQQKADKKRTPLELFMNQGEYEYNFIRTNYISELTNEYQQSAISGDINNDGFQDIIITSGCLCRDANLYEQKVGNEYECITQLSGLTNRSLGPDGILADLNNDGMLDFITCQQEFLRVFRNISIDNHIYLDFDFSGYNNPSNIKTEVIANGIKFVNHMQNGRGFLVQNAPRLHFGLGSNYKIDSVIVYDKNHTQILTNVAQTNKVYFLDASNNMVKNNKDTIIVNTYPNPFQSQLEFEYYLPEKGKMQLSIYSVDGSKILDLINEYKQKGAYKLKWNGKGKNGQAIHSGTYIYKIELNKIKSEGKIIKIN